MADKKESIKIFVSHRIDVESVQIENPLYIPMRCGAIFDTNPNHFIPGDNTGDNISFKRNSFCELTVQYWAWKNAELDYYGLCHYRRYLSFSDREYKTDHHGLVPWPVLSRKAMKRFGLTNADLMENEILQYDLIIPQPAPVDQMHLPHGKAKTVYELWKAHDDIFFEGWVIDRMLQLVEELAPEYSASAKEYFNCSIHRGYNCYIMCKSLFQRLCQFQFPIMEAIEREVTSEQMCRTPAYVGEMLFGVFLHHVITKERWQVSERQLVLFSETRVLTLAEAAHFYLVHWLDQLVRVLAAPFFPLGSKRREICKAFYYRVTKAMKKQGA